MQTSTSGRHLEAVKTNGVVASATIILLLQLLAACAPHPGAGDWLGTGAQPYTRLAVHFNGRAELYVPGEEAERYRCFWGGDTNRSISLDCAHAGSDGERSRFTLNVGDDGVALLLSGGEVVARFRKQAEPPR